MKDTVTQLIYTETSAGRYFTGAGATSYSGLLGGGATATTSSFPGSYRSSAFISRQIERFIEYLLFVLFSVKPEVKPIILYGLLLTWPKV